MFNKQNIYMVILLILILSANSYSQEKKYYYYRPDILYGSEVVFNPLTLLINGSFDIFRNGGHNKDIFSNHYRLGMKNIIRNITNPNETIEQFGWYEFLAQEVIPTSLEKNKAQWFPNYITHIFGNGMQYVKTAEWYDYHNVPNPYLLSVITTTAYQFMNEVVENGSFQGPRIDPISDMLIFNPLGFLFFSTNFGKKFFSETLPMYDWSLQPVYNPQSHFIENAGQQYIVKYKIPKTERYSAFFYWGIHGIVGMSYHHNKIHGFSLGVGQVANKLKERRRNEVKFLTPELDGTIGMFYDKNNSLITSIILTGPRTYNATINIYPGLISQSLLIPGLFASIGEDSGLLIGLTISYFPIGLFRDVD